MRIRDYILISAAFGGEVFEEVRLVGGFLPSAMKNQYGFVPNKFKRRSYLTMVSEMLSVGDIKREVDAKGRSYLVLTSAGKQEFKRKFKIFSTTYKWDGTFMLAIFDIAEKKRKTRDFIRNKLESLGFGMLQESVWISPYHFEEDLRELIKTYELENEVLILTAKRLLWKEATMHPAKIWKLDKVNKRYKSVLEKLDNAKDSKYRQKYLDEAMKSYIAALSKDPLLPKELLPKNWLRNKVLELLDKQ